MQGVVRLGGKAEPETWNRNRVHTRQPAPLPSALHVPTFNTLVEVMRYFITNEAVGAFFETPYGRTQICEI